MTDELNFCKRFMEEYIDDFSSFKSSEIIKKFNIPSVLISTNYSQLFDTEEMIKKYYDNLFIVLKTKRYKFTKIKSLDVTKIPTNSTENFWINFMGERLNAENKHIISLDCNYLLKKNKNSLKFQYIICRNS